MRLYEGVTLTAYEKDPAKLRNMKVVDDFLRDLSSSFSITEAAIDSNPLHTFDDLPFVTIGNTPRLSNERAISTTSPITGTDGGANASFTIALDTATLNPLLDHGLLLGLADDDHLQYVHTAPTTNTRNDITPSGGAVVAVRANSSHFVTEGTAAPSGQVIDVNSLGGFFMESESSNIFGGHNISLTDTPIFTPELRTSLNIAHTGSEAYSTTHTSRIGWQNRISLNDSTEEGGQFMMSFWPMSAGGLGGTGIQESNPATDTSRRDILRFRANANAASGTGGDPWDGRGSLVLGLTRAVKGIDAGEEADPWNYDGGGDGGTFKSRLAVYCGGGGTEHLNDTSQRGSDAVGMHGVMIVAQTARMPGNSLRWQVGTDRDKESQYWSTQYQDIVGIPHYIRTVPATSGVPQDGGTVGRYMTRYHVTGITTATVPTEDQFDNQEAVLDVISEFQPQRGIRHPRFIYESGNRVMFRPARELVNIGGDPTLSPGEGVMVWQGSHDPTFGALEIDGRIRLWAEGGVSVAPYAASDTDNEDAAHAPDGFDGGTLIEETKGVDFAYDKTADLVRLYKPGSTTEVARFSGASIAGVGGEGFITFGTATEAFS